MRIGQSQQPWIMHYSWVYGYVITYLRIYTPVRTEQKNLDGLTIRCPQTQAQGIYVFSRISCACICVNGPNSYTVLKSNDQGEIVASMQLAKLEISIYPSRMHDLRSQPCYLFFFIEVQKRELKRECLKLVDDIDFVLSLKLDALTLRVF